MLRAEPPKKALKSLGEYQMEQLNNVLNQVKPYLDQVAPYVDLAAYVSVAIAAIALLAVILRLFTGRYNWLVRLSARLLMLLGLLFLIYQGALLAEGTPLSASASIFGQPMWIFGLGLFIAGFVFKLIGSLRPAR